ncbi:peptidoglycan/LPS O-acetylase OafA/YrhL [Pontibacter ummariensis]|uniref:Peptidoglycan/LPS O-acetylase OafA/YrhL, contains acyltransferase and SGNH-hydrolase domains n=1 Tax=Pontibacter ummariensis TaxID=1610492 RepID=A0A239HJX4_9BACT|nr:acyltransferase [Pontibacter ummariensis]PRY10587.1 peptidoglycan/LPS O-acetylase OafA/YrhL [Pontibacter ummariensis]SNS80564.1 Peptidoglycan/LPS O-acetylase OafA/YrhL, contains acyltransferase and SGNH-hydrolase domains [Pontibacter ummariensis]
MRIKELDALRGLAAIAVFLFHFQLLGYGYLGVHLFFMISGFVIFLTAKSVKTPFEFVIARFSRLYPTYWVCVLLTFLVVLLDGKGVTLEQLFYNLTMFQMFLGQENIDGAYWSLAEELVFYGIVFGVLVVGALRNVRLWTSFMLLAAVGGLFLNREVEMQKNLQDVVKYFGLFVAGILFYQVYDTPKLKLEHVIGLLLCLIISTQYPYGWYLDYHNHTYEVLILSTFFAVFSLLVVGKLAFLSKYKWLLFVGEVSYPFYLLHEEIGLAFRRLFPSEDILVHWVLVGVIFAGIALASSLINKYIEKEASRSLKNYLKSWSNRKQGAASGVPITPPATERTAGEKAAANVSQTQAGKVTVS